MRIDKLLWYLRFARTRPNAQALCAEGHIRVNGRRIERAHHKICVGDVLTIPHGQTVHVVELITLPIRRGPAPEARAHYRTLDGGGFDPIAAAAIRPFEEGFAQP